ncbi:MAG: hypothetical protein Q8M02_10575 [Candidatus Didemnitutus sp.]|nr:hypothetical protein [Candidatus Didemnitutus sp.]
MKNTPEIARVGSTNGSAVCAWCREPAGHTLGECPAALNREEAVAALLQSRELLRELADCYFLRRSEGLLELMMRADRMLSPNPDSAKNCR